MRVVAYSIIVLYVFLNTDRSRIVVVSDTRSTISPMELEIALSSTFIRIQMHTLIYHLQNKRYNTLVYDNIATRG